MLERELSPPLPDSALAAWERRLEAGEGSAVGDHEQDCLLYVFGGSGTIMLDGRESRPRARSRNLVLAGEHGELEAGSSGLAALLTTVAPSADRHAPMGRRELTTRLDDAGAERASGARSFQILFGPHSGSTRATLFAGFIPPGEGALALPPVRRDRLGAGGTGPAPSRKGTEELGPGSAFRLRPRQVHIVENLSADREMTVIGIFTPALVALRRPT